MIGIGIDTGGTYTDAVAYNFDTKEVLSFGKALTTRKNLEIGIANALDALHPKHLQQAELLALSTTLVTNACVENKGSRAKLVFIGVSENTLNNFQSCFHNYGFRDREQLILLDGKPENFYEHPEDPDWNTFREQIPELFANCQSIGITQVYASANAGRFEKEARELLQQNLSLPITTAYGIFDETDVLKRGASTLLNARLIPLFQEFLMAVKNVIQKKNLNIPIAIVKSDGNLMSETAARKYPVETLLSGPAASTLGGVHLVHQPNAIIVDMGGTTTDITMVDHSIPVVSEKGIFIGQWRTMIQGLKANTVGLGGDSAVRYHMGKLFLDTRRIIPITQLADSYPQILETLHQVAAIGSPRFEFLHEFYVLLKDIQNSDGYSPEEKALCEALADCPLTHEQLRQKLEVDSYFLPVERLEEEGVLMRSGLTPTDVMQLKGDFHKYDTTAARLTIDYLSYNVPESSQEIPDKVYDLVIEKMYKSIAKALIRHQYKEKGELCEDAFLESMLSHSYLAASSKEPTPWITLPVHTDLPLVGVGAPIHVFLPRVAALLGTTAIIPENAAVANALGAICGQVITRVQVKIMGEHTAAGIHGYSVFRGTEKHEFKKYTDAEAFASSIARDLVLEKAREEGASSNPKISVAADQMNIGEGESAICLESTVVATAVDAYQI